MIIPKFPLFSELWMDSADTIILLIVITKKDKKILIQFNSDSIIVNLVMLYDV